MPTYTYLNLPIGHKDVAIVELHAPKKFGEEHTFNRVTKVTGNLTSLTTVNLYELTTLRLRALRIERNDISEQYRTFETMRMRHVYPHAAPDYPLPKEYGALNNRQLRKEFAKQASLLQPCITALNNQIDIILDLRADLLKRGNVVVWNALDQQEELAHATPQNS